MKNNKSKTEAMAAWYEKNKAEPGQYDDYAARLDQLGLWAFGDGYDAGQASACNPAASSICTACAIMLASAEKAIAACEEKDG